MHGQQNTQKKMLSSELRKIFCTDKEQFWTLCKETRSIRYQTIITELLSCLG